MTTKELRERVEKKVLNTIKNSSVDGVLNEGKLWNNINILETNLFYIDMIDYQTREEKEDRDVLTKSIKILRNLFY
jgi:hypothetical protein